MAFRANHLKSRLSIENVIFLTIPSSLLYPNLLQWENSSGDMGMCGRPWVCLQLQTDSFASQPSISLSPQR